MSSTSDAASSSSGRKERPSLGSTSSTPSRNPRPRTSSIVGEVRGRGFLLGVELVDPRDGRSFLPDELDAASLVDDIAFDLGLLVSSTHSTPAGYAGDEVLIAPAYTSTDAELAQMVERFAATVASLERRVLHEVGRQPVATAQRP